MYPFVPLLLLVALDFLFPTLTLIYCLNICREHLLCSCGILARLVTSSNFWLPEKPPYRKAECGFALRDIAGTVAGMGDLAHR